MPARSRAGGDQRTREARSGRGRRPTLSREAVLDSAIALLDQVGVGGLTLRGLAAELDTGVGSIYWYVEGKDRLVDLATDAVLGRALECVYAIRTGDLDPGEIGAASRVEAENDEVAEALTEVRRISLAIYRQIIQHRWLALRLIQDGPVDANAMRLWDEIGQQIMCLDLTKFQQFYAASTVVNYVTGVAAAMDPPGRVDVNDGRTRGEIMDAEIDRWFDGVDHELPFVSSVLNEFRTHDETEQFTEGLDLILLGLRHQTKS